MDQQGWDDILSNFKAARKKLDEGIGAWLEGGDLEESGTVPARPSEATEGPLWESDHE